MTAAATERAPATSSGGRTRDAVARALAIADNLARRGFGDEACELVLRACDALEDELAERGHEVAIAARRFRAGELWGPA